MNVCPIYAASLSHHTLCMGNVVWFQSTHITGWPPKKITNKRKVKRVTAPILKLTYDQKLETFLGGLIIEIN